jgi:hypothetical protein
VNRKTFINSTGSFEPSLPQGRVMKRGNRPSRRDEKVCPHKGEIYRWFHIEVCIIII